MTTIILVIVGVLIAALAALFVIFYGGDAFTSSQAKSDAARLVGEGVQIQAAVQAFRAQEDRMPGDGSGVDYKALRELVCNQYLTHVPVGIDSEKKPSFNCASDATLPTDQSSPWKIDYNYGIARSVVGLAHGTDGKETQAYAVCRAARKQVGLSGDPKRCDAADITGVEPCCIMSADDAAA